jgi:hypothetical protein
VHPGKTHRRLLADDLTWLKLVHASGSADERERVA